MTYKTLANVIRGVLHEDKKDDSSPMTPVIDAETKKVETPKEPEVESQAPMDSCCSNKKITKRDAIELLRRKRQEQKKKIIDNA